ncbi:MAG: choice-of-anchor Q domain-containing protein, partial [Candidatus Contendobacter sp.]
MSIYSLPAGAATFTVTNLNDSGPGSLRQAVLDANATLGADTIAFQAGLTGTITLTTGEIQITDALTLNGPGATALAISGNNASRIFFLPDVMTGKVLTINQLTLKNGKARGDSAIASYGGAIYGAGSLMTLNNCVLSGNSASARGGAVDKFSGTLTVNNSALINNSATSGGAISNVVPGGNSTVTVNNSTLSYNKATLGGGIYNQGPGGDSGGIIIVNNSTMFGNSASTGGGIHSFGHVLSVNNSTVSGNSANQGGGIWFWGYYNNQSPPSPGDTGAIANSIVAGNISPDGKEIYRDSSDNPGLLTSLGHNLFGENGADGLVNVTKAASDLVLAGAIATAIGPLADNGGPTQTQLPVPGSPALNHGDNARIPAGIATDQRGSGFPRIVNDVVDIGAVDVQPSGSLVAGLTSTGQIYYTAVAPPTAGDEGQPTADADADADAT